MNKGHNKKGLKSLLAAKTKAKPNAKASRDWRLHGFFDSPDIHSQLVLIAFGLQKAKSELLRTIVRNWLKENDAVSLVVAQIKNSSEGSDPGFKKRLQKFLRRKKVSQVYIDKVLKQL